MVRECVWVFRILKEWPTTSDYLPIIRDTGYRVLWGRMTGMSKRSKYSYQVLCRKYKSTESSFRRWTSYFSGSVGCNH